MRTDYNLKFLIFSCTFVCINICMCVCICMNAYILYVCMDVCQAKPKCPVLLLVCSSCNMGMSDLPEICA